MTEPTPQVSIVIPTYNRAQLLPATLDSALAQAGVDCEIIVIDDGSTDDTRAAITPYLSRVSYHYRDNRGASAARNAGIELARGEWIAFLDSDDLWESDRMKCVLEFARAHPDAGYIATGRRFIRAEGQRTDKTYAWRSRDSYVEPDDMLSGWRPGSGVVSRELAQRVGGFDEAIAAGEDLDFCLRLVPHTRVAELSKPLLLQRLHGRTLSRDHLKTAHGRLRIVEKLERDQPEFARNHARLIAKLRAGAHSRMGRALLTETDYTRLNIDKAREHFVAARRFDPRSFRNWWYLIVGYAAPRWYRRRKLARAKQPA